MLMLFPYEASQASSLYVIDINMILTHSFSDVCGFLNRLVGKFRGTIEFFAFNTKLPDMSDVANQKILQAAKKGYHSGA